MSKKNALKRRTCQMVTLGPMNAGKPRHGRMHIKRRKRRGPKRG